MTPTTLDSRLDGVVGGRTAKALQRAFDMHTVRDLLWHVPRRYSERGELTPLKGLPIGEHVTVLAQVLDVRSRRTQRGGNLVEARITDGVGSLQLLFFNQPWRARELFAGLRGIFAGKVSEYRGTLQLQHPDYELFDGSEGGTRSADEHVTPEQASKLAEAAAQAFAERPVPIYPATASLPSWTIGRAVGLALDAVAASKSIVDPLPDDLRVGQHLLPLDEAFELVHRPNGKHDWRSARDSLRFREAFDLQMALLDRRRRAADLAGTARPRAVSGLLDVFDETLPFELTPGQLAAGETIALELSDSRPMHRLLQGEVGSGKTIVAIRAMLQVAESGGQSALLAPTEVLAAQHFRSITETLGPDLTAQLRPVLLTSKMSAADRRSTLLALVSGQSRIAVGTHALISEGVEFHDLGLIIVDEQHRFGVEQREALRLKGVNPHVLAMTATPIPRTVALTAFGDLETSVIRDLPPGRQGIDTFAVPVHERPKWAERAWVRALEEIAQGRQVYVVCPAISAGQREDGDEDPQSGDDSRSAAGSAAARVAAPLANVEQTLAELRARADYADVTLAALTGAMKPDEKDRVMRAFAEGAIDVLVATTVIEVGVNVPNASLMIVRDADRFGVSQLHQLRGRVGRGDLPGLCLLLTAAEPGSVARERVEAVAQTNNGFELAERDLQLRREGDILGTAQSGGRSTLRLLRVAEHGEIIERARTLAAQLLSRDPGLESAPLLAKQLADEAKQRDLDNLAKS